MDGTVKCAFLLRSTALKCYYIEESAERVLHTEIRAGLLENFLFSVVPYLVQDGDHKVHQDLETFKKIQV